MSEPHALPLKAPRPWAKRLGFSVAALLLLAYGLPYSQPLFAALFPCCRVRFIYKSQWQN